MIFGMGVDIQEIRQIQEIYNRKEMKFLERVFTAGEIHYCQKHREPFKHYAARWAIKEAFLKALGTGISKGHSLQDIETINLPSGKPEVNVYGKVKETCEQLGITSLISISHSGNYAIGQVLLYREQPREM